jgi:hypothetical protein
MGLGLVGFDHLHIVFRSDDLRQERWFVMEGLREAAGPNVHLGVEGVDGVTTLAEANGGLTGEALADRIGTSASRATHDIAGGVQAIEAWAALILYAGEIQSQQFPYIAWALPGSPLPTVNSSSLVASLLHHAGFDVTAALPPGLRLSPGTTTLLGTSHDDTLRGVNGFTTLLGGTGRDDLRGGDNGLHIDKLYGGAGGDTLRWSRGMDLIHGGQPGLDYAADGFDTVDLSGAGHVRIEAPTLRERHRHPDFIASHRAGEARLYSIEEIVWDANSDTIAVGRGVGLAAPPPRVVFRGNANAPGPRGILDLSQADVGFDILIDADASGEEIGHSERETLSNTLHVKGVNRILASPHDDQFIVSAQVTRLTIENASPQDRIVLATSPMRLAAGYEANDLIIRLCDDCRAAATLIRIRDFERGDLGLAPERPLTLARHERGSVLVSDDLSDRALALSLAATSPAADAVRDLIDLALNGFDGDIDAGPHEFMDLGSLALLGLAGAG